MGRARKIKGVHLDCPSCGTRIVVDSETGEVEAYDDPDIQPEIENPTPKDDGSEESDGSENESWLSKW